MTNILSRVAKESAQIQYGQFQPTTTLEFFALRLAAKLGDAGAAHHYAELTKEHSMGQLLSAYGRALVSNLDVARRFHRELEPLRDKSIGTGWGSRLAAIRIERRAVAVATLTGDHLKHADARQLSSSPNKALGSATGFVTRFLERFRCESAALEIIPDGHEVQRTLLHQAVLRVLSAQAIGIIEVPKADLMTAFSYPVSRFRSDLRKTISDIYPSLSEGPGCPWTYDAAALGLYVQTERLFNNINQTLL
jgi:hypothetical protein